MSSRLEKSRHDPVSGFKRFGLFVLTILLLQEVKRARSVPEHALGAGSPQVIFNQSASFSVPHKISGHNGQEISRSHSDSNLERQETKHSFTDGDFGETNSSTVVKGNEQVLESQRPPSSQFSSLDISSWDNKRHSSKIDTDVLNLSQPRNSTTSLQSNSLIAITKVRNAEDTSTPSKSKRRSKNKLQSEVKLLSEKSSSLSNDHDFKSKHVNDVTKTFNKSRKKKRRKYISWINSAKHHRRKRSHRRISGRKLVDFNKVKTKESERIRNKRSVYPLGIYPQFRGAGNERVLLRFKRKALLEDGQEELPRNRKKRKRKRREKASQRQVKRRSLPRQNVPNVEISGLKKGYSQSLLWRKSAFGRGINGFGATTAAVNPQVKYDRQITPGQSVYVVPNSYKVILRPDQYVQRKRLPVLNFAQSNALVAQNGQVPVAKIPYGAKNSAMKSVRPGKFQRISSVEQPQFEQLAKYHYATRQPQRPLNNNVAGRKQVTQRPFYVFAPHFSSSQIALPDRNRQIERVTQPWSVKPQFYGSQQGTRMPEIKSHLPQANDLLKGSLGPQGLIMYLNFEDVEQGKSPFASFYGNLADAGKRTEISRSFGSCGKVARINNGSEILLNGRQIKVKPRQAISIAAWIKLDTNKGLHSIFDTVGGHSLHQKGQYHFEIQDGSVRWFHRNESDNTIFSVETDPIIPAKVWNHVAGTYDALTGIAKVFVNGRLKAETAGKGVLSQDWDAHAGIGKHKGSRFLQGDVDEFRIYNKALTQEEIQNLTKMCSFERACGGFFYSPTGVIESPEWPHHYKGKSLCTWHVVVDSSEKIALRFNTFALEEDNTCSKAKLVVRDGNSENANVLGVYCGNRRPPELTSTGNHLLLQFTSTEGAEGRGFLLHYDIASFRQTKKTERPPTPFDGTQRCAVTKPEYNVTLVGGIKSGIFSEARIVHDLDLCTRHCCLREFCDLAFMIRDTCYLVKCANQLLCKTKKARPSSMNPRISFVSHLSAVTPEPGLSVDGSAYSKAAAQSTTTPSSLELSTDGSAYSKTGTQSSGTSSTPEVSADGSAYSKASGTQSAAGSTIFDLSASGSAYSKPIVANDNTLTASPPSAEPDCHHTAVSYNVTLVAGINAGKFSTYGSARNMDECIRHCCHDDTCDVSFMIQGNCYAVECADTEGCQIKRAKPSSYHPTVAYVYRGGGRPIGDPLPGAEKPSLDACSKLTVSNTIHNVTLRGGIKAGNFTDKGVVKNMEECSAFCCADEQCNVAFLIRDNCFLVACKDYDSCKMKPALSEYYRPRMAYVNWSPPDDEIPANRWYASLGCWKDTESSSVSSLEGSDSLLQGSYLKRDKPIDTCAQVARKHEYKVFAIQNGGACLGDPAAEHMFNQYGESSACKEGKGGPFVNDVYRLTDSGSYVSLGCWNDSGSHALTLLEHSDPRLNDFYQTRIDPLQKCGRVARKRGYTVFAVQRGGMCFSGPLAEIHYRKFGMSRRCHDGLGGSYANSVYRLIDNLETTPSLPTTGISTSSIAFTEVSSSASSNDFTPTTGYSSQATSASPTTRIQENYLTLQDGVPLRNSYTSGDILYNVTLKFGIKAGKFSDKGKVGNMSDCIKACGKMETCSLAFMLGKQCFAVSCYDDALCLTKPAYSPFYKPQIAFVKHTKEIFNANASKGALSDFSQCRTSIVHNDVTLVGGINAGKFTDLGDAENMTICSQRCCFKDACDVAFMLEGECYGVKCINESLCETRPARNPARYNPKIVYVYHDKKKDEASSQQKSVCWDGEVLHNYTLVGGINAGTFTDNGKASNMDICMQFCCKRDTCDLAFMIEDDCYSVACNRNGACEPRKARPTHYLPRIAIRKKPQGNSNVNVPSSTAPTSSSTLTPTLFLSSSPTPATSSPTITHSIPEGHQTDSSVKVAHSCDSSTIEYNVTLKMGLHSGEFQKIGKVESMDDCIEMSCRQPNSDVAFMLGSICFAVHCYSADLCKTVPIFGSSISRLNLNPAISFLRKKSRFRTNSLAVQNDEIYQDRCRDSTITYNVTLRGGIDAGNFTERAGTLTMRDCIGKCCDDKSCDLAFMFGDSCYSVECRNEKLCQAVLAKPSRLEPKISYITRGYFDDKDKGTMFSASDQTPTCRADQKSRSAVISNKTLVGGLEAGKFTFVGVVSDMDMCMDRCCAQRGCNVAYMVDSNCFSVSCFSPTLCKISDVPSSNGDVKISTIMNSTAGRHSEKNSMIVYVIIGVVGFAAGAGGILWAVCMFIRRHRLRSRHRQDTE